MKIKVAIERFLYGFAIVSFFIAVATSIWWSVCVWGDLQDCLIWGKDIWEWTQLHTTFAIGLITIFVFISVGIFAVLQLMSMSKSRYSALIMHFNEHWESAELVKVRHEIDKKRCDILAKLQTQKLDKLEIQNKLKKEMGKTTKNAHDNAEQFSFLIKNLLGFLETLAFLTRRHYIPKNDVEETFGPPMVYYYDLFEDYIKIIREELFEKHAYCDLEVVADEFRQPLI